MKSLDEKSGTDEDLKEPQQEPQALDFEADAKAFSQRVIKGLEEAIKKTEDEFLKTTLNTFIPCFARFDTVTGMLTPVNDLSMAKFIQIYINAQREDQKGATAYKEYSEHRQALREKKVVPVFQNLQLQEIQQNKPPEHICGPDCNHEEVGTSQVKRNPCKP